MIYSQTTIEALFQKNLQQAKALLATLEVYSGREPNFTGLSGWVFEQTIRHCIRNELELLGVNARLIEQVTLRGSAKVDLVVGTTAIEIKTSGLFRRDEIDQQKKRQSDAAIKGLRYVFLTLRETNHRHRAGMIETLGRGNVIFLDEPGGEWERLIDIIVDGLKLVTA